MTLDFDVFVMADDAAFEIDLASRGRAALEGFVDILREMAGGGRERAALHEIMPSLHTQGIEMTLIAAPPLSRHSPRVTWRRHDRGASLEVCGTPEDWLDDVGFAEALLNPYGGTGFQYLFGGNCSDVVVRLM